MRPIGRKCAKLSLIRAALSPVYFTMDQAPLLMKSIGYISPLRYAADAIEKSLSGQSDVWAELGILSAIAIDAISLVLRRLPWRERQQKPICLWTKTFCTDYATLNTNYATRIQCKERATCPFSIRPQS